DPRVKVLYVEGRLQTEYRFLRRDLAGDPNVELATMLRVQADRWYAGGSVNGAAFDWQQIPSDPAQWKKFDVIILGDVDSSFLQGPAMAAIEQAVANGAGLMMTGGENNFGAGGYAGTPIERALPVMVGDGKNAQDTDKFVPRLTPDGLVNPAMAGLADFFGSGNKAGAKPLPPLYGNVIVNSAKSGAQVLLTHPDHLGPDGKPEIVLAVERYGKGRSAAFTVDTTYLWDLPLYGMGQDSPYNRLWGQLVRWLAGTDVRNRQRGPGVEGLLNKSTYQLGENVHIRAMVRDEHGDATRYAQVSVKLQRVGEVAQRSLSLNPVDSHIGMYDLVIPHPDKGDWVMDLTAAKDGKPLGAQRLKFTVIPPDDEMLKLAANPKLLSELAAATHGSSYDLAGLPTLLDSLTKGIPTEKQQSIPLYNFLNAALTLTGRDIPWPAKADLPIEGLMVFALLAAEWILRRRWQLT
ncbi:MAG TPA: glutamine amidotransferase, partial [Tepidisphaeraceae bacterium]|nr:glutamine amidotransferase [Tepidisphaeraceae bacterium]